MDNLSVNNSVQIGGFDYKPNSMGVTICNVTILKNPKSRLEMGTGGILCNVNLYDHNSHIKFYSVRKIKLLGVIPWLKIAREL